MNRLDYLTPAPTLSYPVYDGNVRIGTVRSASETWAKRFAQSRWPLARNLRVLAPYIYVSHLAETKIDH